LQQKQNSTNNIEEKTVLLKSFFNENNKVGNKTPTEILDIILHNLLSNPYSFDYSEVLKKISVQLRISYIVATLHLASMKVNTTQSSHLSMSCYDSEYKKVLKITNTFCLKEKVDFKVFIKTKVARKSNHDDEDKNTTTTDVIENFPIEKIVHQVYEKYILAYPYSSFFQYFKPSITNNNNNNNIEEKKSITLIIIQNNETENEKDIENTVWQTLENYFLELNNNQYSINEIKSFFEVIIQTAVKCVAYKPGDRFGLRNLKHKFVKNRETHDGILKSTLPIVHSFFSHLYNYLFTTGNEPEEKKIYENVDIDYNGENENLDHILQEEGVYHGTFSSYVMTEDSSQLYLISAGHRIAPNARIVVKIPPNQIKKDINYFDGYDLDDDYHFHSAVCGLYFTDKQAFRLCYNYTNLLQLYENTQEIIDFRFPQIFAISDVSIFYVFDNKKKIIPNKNFINNEDYLNKIHHPIKNTTFPTFNFEKNCLGIVNFDIYDKESNTHKKGQLNVIGYGHFQYVISMMHCYEIFYIAEYIIVGGEIVGGEY
jgi:hypothetical protein